MACPMRFVLAALSAFVAFFLIWRRKTDEDGDDSGGNAATKLTKLLDPENKGWTRTVVGFCTGRFLYDVFTGRIRASGGGLHADVKAD